MHRPVPIALATLVLLVVPAAPLWSQSSPILPPAASAPVIIDTHVHIDVPANFRDFEGAVEGAVKHMDAAGITRSILMPSPQPKSRNNWEMEAFLFARDRFPGRFSLGGGGGSLNGLIQDTAPDKVTESDRREFRARAEKLLAQGAVVLGEVAAHHLSLKIMGSNHPYEATPPDHPLLLLLADIAAENDVPMDLHLDLVPEDMALPPRPNFNPGSNPAQLKENMAAFERLLDHNPKAKIIWAHAGSDQLMTRTVGLQADLLAAHPNLYMSLRIGPGLPNPAVALTPAMTLKPIWVGLLKRYPDRFVLGSDSFHEGDGGRRRGPNVDQLSRYREMLSQLPPELAEAIGHLNAERLFRLK